MPVQQSPDFDAARHRVERRSALLTTLAWLTVLPLLVIALLHVVAHDATPELIALNAFTAWLYLPAWVCMFLGLALRRQALALCAGAVVCAHLVWLDPASPLAAPTPAWTAHGHPLRVMSTNLLLVNRDQSGIGLNAKKRWLDRPEVA